MVNPIVEVAMDDMYLAALGWTPVVSGDLSPATCTADLFNSDGVLSISSDTDWESVHCRGLISNLADIDVACAVKSR